MLVIVNWRDMNHPEAGGAEVVCEQLAKRFAADGRHVVLLCAAVAGRPGREERDGYTVVRRGGRFTVYPAALLWLARHRRRIDGVIDSQNGIPFFTPLAVRRATPVILLLHHVHQQQFGLYFPPLVASVGRWLESTGSRLVYGERAVAAVSPSTRQEARYQLGLKGSIQVVPPGWDSEASHSGALRERRPRETIVSVGRLVPHKRTDLVIAAMPTVIRSIPHVELHLIGSGSEGPKLQRLIDELGLGRNVIMHGSVDSAARDQMVASAWMMVNASAGEGWGLSVVEANAVGTPALAYRRPGLRDSIRDGETGWLIDDRDDLGAKITTVLNDLEDIEYSAGFSQRAQQWSAQFTWTAMAEQMISLLEAERGRLAQSGERRAATDLATVVHVPTHLLPDGWRPAFRLTDRWTMNAEGFAVLLAGADHETISAALRRAGLPEAIVRDPTVRAVVARPRDHISPVAELFEFLDSAVGGSTSIDDGVAVAATNGKAHLHPPGSAVQAS